MEKEIIFFGKKVKASCDENCNKAWGINSRPQDDYGDDTPDGFLGNAPIDPGTYEGGCAKPINKIDIPNKWCVRECERCNLQDII